MAQKTVITRIDDVEGVKGESIFFPQDRLLYVDQFTGYNPDTQDEHALFSPKTLGDVFEHYSPTKENIELVTEDGDLKYESFLFSEIEDFNDESLIANSETMSYSWSKIEIYQDIARHLKQNRDLNRLLDDASYREALVGLFKTLQAELRSNIKD